LSVELIDDESNSGVNIDKVQLVDSRGRFVKEWNEATKKIKLDVQELPKGVYYVKVSIRDAISTTRILID